MLLGVRLLVNELSEPRACVLYLLRVRLEVLVVGVEPYNLLWRQCLYVVALHLTQLTSIHVVKILTDALQNTKGCARKRSP